MKIIENLVDSLRELSGVGEKTADRYAYNILEMDKNKREQLMKNIQEIDNIKYCKKCNNYTLNDICEYCLQKRAKNKLVVVASPKDITKIEKILPLEYHYYVLGGIIDPLNGKGLEQLNIDKLEKRIIEQDIKELIYILPTNNEGELTASYLKKRFIKYDIKSTKLAQGVPIGGDLEYLDELTLLKSIQKRQEY